MRDEWVKAESTISGGSLVSVGMWVGVDGPFNNNPNHKGCGISFDSLRVIRLFYMFFRFNRLIFTTYILGIRIYSALEFQFSISYSH